MYQYLIILICTFFYLQLPFFASSQNTIGLQYINQDLAFGGYTLFYPQYQSDVFLINECGELLHQWVAENQASGPGAVAYLLENGNLIKAISPNAGTGGGGGLLQILNWENEILWTYEASDSLRQQHHDIHVMPNGNILIINWERMDFDAMLAHGFDTSSYIQTELFFDGIQEINPQTDSIVWEWHAWDHLIQDYDASKLNFGNVAQHPEKIDINYQDFTFQKPDFLHSNGIDYNEELDQILLSVRNFNEVWIIDHSTTTAEAASSLGGNSGRGGGLLFRWGNPHAYKAATLEQQKLFRQHDAQWIDDFVDSTYQYFGKIALFNNALPEQISLGQIIAPQWDVATQSYQNEDNLFFPFDFAATFSHPEVAKGYSTSASSIQILGNGHVVMCAARQGRSFELSPEGELVWEYLTPLKFGQAIPQGTPLNLSDNFTFQVQRYPDDFPAFAGKDLTPKGYIELEPNADFCAVVNVENIEKENTFQVYPNPASDKIVLQKEGIKPISIEIYNSTGQKIKEYFITENKEEIDISTWQNGLYFIVNSKTKGIQKLIKTK